MEQSENKGTEKDTVEYLKNIYSHIDNNAEALRRLMLLIVKTMPHLDGEVAAILNEWHRINKEIQDEFNAQ